MDPSLLYTAMGRIYACLHKYKRAADYSEKARQGFLKLWSQKFALKQNSLNQKSHSQSKTESVVEYDEESELYRQLSVACYTHGSHLDKLGNHADGVKYMVEARDYHEKILNVLPRDYEFYHRIETKIEAMRERLNNLTTYAENESLIKSRADQNLSKLNMASHTNIELQTLPMVYSKVDLRGNVSGGETVTTQTQKVRPLTAISSSSKFTAKSKNSRSGGEVNMKYPILKKAEVQTRYGVVTKDPSARKNVDSMGFRVSPLYLHNEYFHGNYDKGIEMFKSTSNNEKFHPYKALNPIPNDKAFMFRTRPTAKKGMSSGRKYEHRGIGEIDRQQRGGVDARLLGVPSEDLIDRLEECFDEGALDVVDLTPEREEEEGNGAGLGSAGASMGGVGEGRRSRLGEGRKERSVGAQKEYGVEFNRRSQEDASASHNMSQLDEGEAD